MFNIFQQISAVENTYFPNADTGIFKITIEDFLFNLYVWLCIIINHMDTFLNPWKYHQSDVKYRIHYIAIQHYNYTIEAFGPLIPYYLFIIFQWFLHFYCYKTYIKG